LLLVGAIAAGAVMVPVIPKHTWTRLTTFSSADSEEIAKDAHLSGAIGSTEARKQLQIRAVQMTIQNPIFGVGPRMFVYALNDFMKVEGYSKGTWQHPHNTYLDISAETGLVGLGLYVTCILWCLRTNYRAVQATRSRRELQPAFAQSCSLLFASVVFSFGTLFCSIPYVGQMPFLLGLTAANWLALRDAGAFALPRMTNPLPRRVKPRQPIVAGTQPASR
jgi:O-antigen ligase